MRLDFPDQKRYDLALLSNDYAPPFPEPPASSTVGDNPPPFLIGREHHLRRMEQVLDQLRRSGRAKLAFVHGRQGVGKSSIVAQFVRQAKADAAKKSTSTSSKKSSSGKTKKK